MPRPKAFSRPSNGKPSRCPHLIATTKHGSQSSNTSKATTTQSEPIPPSIIKHLTRLRSASDPNALLRLSFSGNSDQLQAPDHTRVITSASFATSTVFKPVVADITDGLAWNDCSANTTLDLGGLRLARDQRGLCLSERSVHFTTALAGVVCPPNTPPVGAELLWSCCSGHVGTVLRTGTRRPTHIRPPTLSGSVWSLSVTAQKTRTQQPWLSARFYLVAGAGFEPTTFGL